MNTKTIVIIGGSQEQNFQKSGKKLGCNILFHNGKSRNGGTKKAFLPLIKKADSVVVLNGACGHITMEIVKKLCKELDVPLDFHRGFGVSGALNLGIDAMRSAA